MRVHILGCGPSGGVPLISGYWGKCDPHNPKNSRTRSSLLVQTQGQNILIDTSPDLRQQLLKAGITTIDAVLLTHAHADHCHGMDELRQIFFHQNKKIPVYADGATLEKVQMIFSYMFFSPDRFYPDYLIGHPLESTHFDVNGLPIIHFPQHHGHQNSTGFRIGSMAYSTDVNAFPKESEAFLQGLDVWIVDCLRDEKHYTHAHVDLTLQWVETFRPKQTVLTHMGENLDYDDLLSRCPPHVSPGFDGMIVDLDPKAPSMFDPYAV